MPEPSSAPCPILTCSFTTLGNTFAATCSTEPDAGAATGWWGAGAAAVAAVAAPLVAGRVRVVHQHRCTDTPGHHGDARGPDHDGAGSRTLPHHEESASSAPSQS